MIFISCEKDDESSGPVRFEIDCENSSIEGSFVQNAPMTSLNTFNMHYTGGGNATVSAKEINGVYISSTQVNLVTDGSVKLTIEGKPIELGEFTMKVEVVINDKAYYCSQIFNVDEDTDPTAPITFTMDPKYNTINDLTQAVEIPFTVDPFMSSIVVVEPFVAGLNVKAAIDKKTGNGTLTLTPADDYIGGTLNFVVTFGAREQIPVAISTTPFVKGDGTEESPYEVNSVELLKKMRVLSDRHFKLTENLDMQGVSWQPLGSKEAPFSGSLDGNGKKIENLNITGGEYAAFISYTSSSATIKNLTISGSVTGTNYVAGLVAYNAGTITGCNAENMTVIGENYISGIAAKSESGSISNSNPTDMLSFTDFPSLISEIKAQVTKPLNYSPSTATATIVKEPENVNASISGSSLVLTPQAGFVSAEMTVKVTFKNLSTVEKEIKLFAEEQFDSGNGNQDNPFTISKASQFNKIRDYMDKEKYFLVTADIDLSTVENGWKAIPSFNGTLDGGGHKVTGLIYSDVKGGLITANTGNIKNIIFDNIDITVTSSFGVIAGDHSVGTIENVVVKGKIISTHTGDILGGVVGEITGGQISNVYVDLDMTTSCGMAGAIVGRAITAPSTISNCTSVGKLNITGPKKQIAGIVGRGQTGVVIKNCLSSMEISSTNNSANGIGGIFGANNNNAMRIDECMFTGKISNVFMCGGIAGVAANIRNCISEGRGATMSSIMITVGGAVNTSSTGGIAGTVKETMENCIVRDAAFTGNTTPGQPISGIVSTFQDNGFVKNSVVSNVLVNGTNVHGVAGTNANGKGVNSGNYSSGILYYENGTPSTYTPDNSSSGLDGETKTASDLSQSFYQSLGFDFTNIWKWEGGKPVLRNVGYKGNLPY